MFDSLRSSTLNFLTLYQYDPLDNLTLSCQGGGNAAISNGVCQNGQGRTFTYDSLSRKLTAANLESGSFQYIYDNNGNLLTRRGTRDPDHESPFLISESV